MKNSHFSIIFFFIFLIKTCKSKAKEGMIPFNCVPIFFYFLEPNVHFHSSVITFSDRFCPSKTNAIAMNRRFFQITKRISIDNELHENGNEKKRSSFLFLPSLSVNLLVLITSAPEKIFFSLILL